MINLVAMMKLGKINVAILGCLALVITACNTDKTTPNYTFMDDMYISPTIETYGADGGSKKPVENTVARGHMPYIYPNTNEGYEMAKTELNMPAEYNSEAMRKEGKALYVNMCGHCHGKKGDGNGSLVEREKYLGVPGYDKTRLPDITPGSMYHVIMYGRNMMGSHASQLLEEERWKIISYIWYDVRGEKVVAEQSNVEGNNSSEVEIEVEVTE